MTAETVYNVIQALPRKEKPRLYRMLGVAVPEGKKAKKIIISDAESKDYLIKLLKLFRPK